MILFRSCCCWHCLTRMSQSATSLKRSARKSASRVSSSVIIFGLPLTISRIFSTLLSFRMIVSYLTSIVARTFLSPSTCFKIGYTSSLIFCRARVSIANKSISLALNTYGEKLFLSFRILPRRSSCLIWYSSSPPPLVLVLVRFTLLSSLFVFGEPRLVPVPAG